MRQSNAKVSIDLSGSGNRIDSTGLGVSASSLQSGGVSVGSYDLRNKTNVLNNTNNDGSQVFTFNLAGGSSVAATVIGWVPASSLAGVHESRPVCVLNVAPAGAVCIESVTASPSSS